MIRIRSQQNRRKLLKDIKFAISSIVLNVTYFLLALPICIADLKYFNPNEMAYIILVYYMIYCANFYILMISNSLFRREVFILFKCKGMFRFLGHESKTKKVKRPI